MGNEIKCNMQPKMYQSYARYGENKSKCIDAQHNFKAALILQYLALFVSLSSALIYQVSNVLSCIDEGFWKLF